MNRTVWGISQNYFIFSDTYYWVKNNEENVGEKFKMHSFAHNLESEYSDQKLYTQIYMLRNELDNNHYELIKITDSVHLVYKKIINYSFEIREQLLYKRYQQDDFKRYFDIINEADYLYRTYYRLQTKFRTEIHKIAEKILALDPENPNRQMEMNLRDALDYQLPLLYRWAIFMNGGGFPYEHMKNSLEYTDEEFLKYEKTPDIDPNVRFHYKRFYSYLNYEHQTFKRSYLNKYDTDSLISDPKFVIWQLISAYNIRCAREHDQFVKKADEIRIYMLKYNYQPYLFIKDASIVPVSDIDIAINENTDDEISYNSMEGYAYNNLVLLLDVSGSMNSEDKLPLLKESFKRLLKILRKEDFVSVVVYSGKAKLVLEPTSCENKNMITAVLDNLKSGGSTNFQEGLELAFWTAAKDFVPNGNNRIILATDGQFEIDKSLFKLTKKHSKTDIHLSVFHFGNEKNKNELIKLATVGKGNYGFINRNNVAIKLIKEAKAVKLN